MTSSYKDNMDLSMEGQVGSGPTHGWVGGHKKTAHSKANKLTINGSTENPFPANTARWPNASLLLGQRPTFGQRCLFVGLSLKRCTTKTRRWSNACLMLASVADGGSTSKHHWVNVSYVWVGYILNKICSDDAGYWLPGMTSLPNSLRGRPGHTDHHIM